jgi:hypothetical protein
VGDTAADFDFRRTEEEMTLKVMRSGRGELSIEFQPALSLRAQVVSVSLNGRPIAFKVQPNDTDQHLQVRFPVYGGPNVLRVQVRHDFAITYTSHLPLPGARSQGLRIPSEEWSNSKDQLTLHLEGLPGKSYELSLFQGREVSSVDGGTLERAGNEATRVLVTMPAEAEPPVRKTLVLLFLSRSGKDTR